MTVKLICLDPVATNTEFLLDSLPVCIGRSPDAEIQIQDSWASRFHCEIGECNGTLVVRDLGSSNGTLINGRQISESPLLPGDELTVGISTFLANYRGEELYSAQDVLSEVN